MRIDPGLAVIIIAVFVFYLRLIILQRERAKRAAYQSKPAGKKPGKRPQKDSSTTPAPQYSVVSQNKRDWIIAGSGILLIFIGLLLNLKIIPIPLAQTYWWLPVAIGIVAFSWGFK